MGKILNIATGISTIGNALDVSQDIEALNDVNLESVKTLVDGQWKSWTKGADAAFQGFTDLASGRGYIVNSSGDTTVELTGNILDINDLNILPGLQLLAAPYSENEIIGSGYVSGMKISSMKTIDGNWKSWTTGAADDFQGFIDLDNSKGYVANIEQVFDNYTDVNTDVSTSGVKIVKELTMDASVDGGVVFDTTSIDSIWYGAVSYDDTLSLKMMYVDINGESVKIDYPIELTDTVMYITNNVYSGTCDSIIVNNGTIVEASDVTNDYGSITDTNVTTTTELGSITDVGSVITGTSIDKVIFSENTDSTNPVGTLGTIDPSDIEITYTSKVFDNTLEPKIMNIEFNNITSLIEFAPEYLGDSFLVWNDGKVYNGVFTDSPTIQITIAEGEV